MSSALDNDSPCETPSDVIFIIDGQSPDKLKQSGEIVAAVSGSLTNIRAKGGAVSIFLNSQQKSNNPDVRLPTGPGDWPLGAAAFKSTSYGCASCRVNDFKSSIGKMLYKTIQFYLKLFAFAFSSSTTSR
jgi:hypothetical protein